MDGAVGVRCELTHHRRAAVRDDDRTASLPAKNVIEQLPSIHPTRERGARRLIPAFADQARGRVTVRFNSQLRNSMPNNTTAITINIGDQKCMGMKNKV
jgi:hypothetical protein